MFVFSAGVDLDAIVRAVNQVGAAPGDLVAIWKHSNKLGRCGGVDCDLGVMSRGWGIVKEHASVHVLRTLIVTANVF